MDESMPVNLKPLECRSNRPHQFSTANGIFVTKIEPGRAEGFLQVTRDSLKEGPRGGAGRPGGHGGRELRLRPGAQLRHRQSVHGVSPPGGGALYHLRGHPQEGGTHPVGDPGGAVQRGGKAGGHGDLHLFYDGPVVRGECRVKNAECRMQNAELRCPALPDSIEVVRLRRTR